MLKDTRLLGIGHRSGAASCHVAVEGHLQSVAVGRVIKETAKEPSTGTGLHYVPVEGCVGLEEYTKKQRHLRQCASGERDDTSVRGFGFKSLRQQTSTLLKHL